MYTQGQKVWINGYIIPSHERQWRRDWINIDLENPMECMVIGHTYKQEGTIREGGISVNYDYTEAEYEQNYLEVENMIPAIMVVPVTKKQYRKPLAVREEQILK